MFPPYNLTPGQFLRDFTYRHLRVWNVSVRDRNWQKERARRHGDVY